jgi:hypothetical protein
MIKTGNEDQASWPGKSRTARKSEQAHIREILLRELGRLSGLIRKQGSYSLSSILVGPIPGAGIAFCGDILWSLSVDIFDDPETFSFFLVPVHRSRVSLSLRDRDISSIVKYRI